MQPNITGTETWANFLIADGLGVRLLHRIQPAGGINYHLILVVFDPDDEVCIFTASEFMGTKDSAANKPVFGVFHDDRHWNLGFSEAWTQVDLFLLKSMQAIRARFPLPEGELLRRGH